MPLDGVSADEQVSLLRDDVPDKESRPDGDGLIGKRALTRHAFVPQVLQSDACGVAPESGEALPRLTMLAGRPPAEAIEAFDADRGRRLIARLETHDFALARFGPAARLVPKLRGIAETTYPRWPGE